MDLTSAFDSVTRYLTNLGFDINPMRAATDIDFRLCPSRPCTLYQTRLVPPADWPTPKSDVYLRIERPVKGVFPNPTDRATIYCGGNPFVKKAKTSGFQIYRREKEHHLPRLWLLVLPLNDLEVLLDGDHSLVKAFLYMLI